jgi:NADH-quinone oxidoreductase subunit G
MATIEIDGKTFEAENGKMIIEVADEAGIHIPRFCYHKKLSVAANCRMCLVEIENSKKTVPACATPISQGMKVYTQSQAAVKSQKAVMEFLLINHPLDCPICDQGGECELQDVSMGFGSSEGDYQDTKRSVNDKSLGTLIETEMTRCIHCTRCVRFGEEIAGLREMGAPYRGEHVQIGTFVEKSMRSEISANIIDLCPVGALTSKPYRYTARSWELQQKPSIAAFDCLGSHVYLHTRRGKLMRTVPKDCESINETWISDRDRFAYTGLYHENRLALPMIKQKGKWKTVDWSDALNFAASRLGEVLAKHGPESVAAFASSSASTEELYILQKWMRALNINNIDHRLNQTDFHLDELHVGMSKNTCRYVDIENQESILLFGTQLHREVPLAATRVRKAFLNGAKIASLNAAHHQFSFALDTEILVNPTAFEQELAGIMHALKIKHESLSVVKEKTHQQAIASLLLAERSLIITGSDFETHPRYHVLRAMLEEIITSSEIKWLHISSGANSYGAWRVGFVPHSNPNGEVPAVSGMNVVQALKAKLKAYILHGVEPSYDFAHAKAAQQAMQEADLVIAVTAFKTDDLLASADILLPMASFGETSGTFINIDGLAQSFEGAAMPYEQARPAWKIYRVLANLSHCDGFDYVSSEEIKAELFAKDFQTQASKRSLPKSFAEADDAIVMMKQVSLYAEDMLLRHAIPLQQSASADILALRIHPKLVEELKLGNEVTVTWDGNELSLPIMVDSNLCENVVCIPRSTEITKNIDGEWVKVSLQ